MKKIVPFCKTNTKPYIDVEGRWHPCCHFHMTRKFEIIGGDQFLVQHNDDVNNFHKLPSFVEWVTKIENDFDSAPNICKKICGTIDDKDSDRWNFTPQFYINNYSQLFQFMDENEID